MANILITGGAGNLGKTLAHALSKEGHGLHIFDLPSCSYDFFDGWENTRVFKGDILEPGSMKKALQDLDWVYHLVAILPPASEANKDFTFKVNVEGTRNLLEMCQKDGDPKKIVFASSISVFGDSTQEKGLIRAEQALAPYNFYAESKVEAEKLLFSSGLPCVNLRVSGIVIPIFLDPPEPWPFTKQQPIEMVALNDLVKAMTSIPNVEKALNRTLIIAGGKSWQVTGEEYVRTWGDVMEIPLEEMSFQETPGYLNWFDTEESQGLLGYQQTSMDQFFKELDIAVQEALA